MQLKDRLVKEIENLPPEDLMDIYEMVLDLKEQKKARPKDAKPTYLEVQEILKKCPGSLSDGISRLREDRI